jgi:hypothetical protein
VVGWKECGGVVGDETDAAAVAAAAACAEVAACVAAAASDADAGAAVVVVVVNAVQSEVGGSWRIHCCHPVPLIQSG